jgi:hypothetical protein
VDAFSRVSHEIYPQSIGAVKQLEEGAKVILRDVVVSSETYSTGRYCYIQQADRSSGIKLVGRVFDRGVLLDMVCGVIDTQNGEKVILATSALPLLDEYNQEITVEVKPLGMKNSQLGGVGLSTKNLLVKTWGKVVTVDASSKSFVIDDGSGSPIKCIAPKVVPDGTVAANPGDPAWGVDIDSQFSAPAVGQFVTVVGINSTEADGQGGVAHVVRLRSGSDVQ